jgi:hypothetical protein
MVAYFRLTPLTVEPYWPSTEDLRILEQRVTPAGWGTGALGEVAALATGRQPPGPRDLNMGGALQIVLLAIPPFLAARDRVGHIQALHDSPHRTFLCRDISSLVEELAKALSGYVITYQVYTEPLPQIEEALTQVARLLVRALPQTKLPPDLASPNPHRRGHSLEDCWRAVCTEVRRHTGMRDQPWPERWARTQLLSSMVDAFRRHGPHWPDIAMWFAIASLHLALGLETVAAADEYEQRRRMANRLHWRHKRSTEPSS